MSTEPRKVAVLGSTGSIGTAALDVISKLPERLSLWGIAANRSWETVAEQAGRLRPAYLSMADAASNARLASAVPGMKKGILSHADFCRRAAEEADIVLVAIVGAAGLEGALAAARAGKRVALANKESLVMAGGLVTGAARKSGAEIIPVDSEHSALFQVLDGRPMESVRRVIITASGGPFLDRPLCELENVTVREALSHPTWSMGKKITIDSATMANKAFEVIEARWLFDLAAEKISVLVHPQSVVHSLVEFVDGSVIAQMGVPDMRLPIQYALTYPERFPSSVEPLDLAAAGKLTFREPDVERFPCLQLGFMVAREGGTLGAVFSAANEVAVDAFLAGRIRFGGIYTVVRTVVDKHKSGPADSIDSVIAADAWARAEAENCL